VTGQGLRPPFPLDSVFLPRHQLLPSAPVFPGPCGLQQGDSGLVTGVAASGSTMVNSPVQPGDTYIPVIQVLSLQLSDKQLSRELSPLRGGTREQEGQHRHSWAYMSSRDRNNKPLGNPGWPHYLQHRQERRTSPPDQGCNLVIPARW
jgi:hypothetical protein